jgi:hypothetical protein
MSATDKQTNEQPVTRKMTRPGLLVEDRNAAVRRTSEGEKIVKVLSRPEEAERQGVAESTI